MIKPSSLFSDHEWRCFEDFLGKSDLIFQSINANAVWKTAQKYTVKGQVSHVQCHISHVTNIYTNSYIQGPSHAEEGPRRAGQKYFWAQAEPAQKVKKILSLRQANSKVKKNFWARAQPAWKF